MSNEQRQRYLGLQCHDPVDAPLCEDDPEPPEARASTDTRPWPEGQGPIVFCLMCEDRVQQLFRDCCPNCALQDVMISLEDPLAVELLAQERDIHSKLILSNRLLRLISRTTVEQVLSRRHVKIEPDAPLHREIRRCGFAPDSQDLAFGHLFTMPNAAESIDPDGRFLAAQPIAMDVAMQTDYAADYSDHGNCSISGSSCQDWDPVDAPVPTPLLPQGREALSPSHTTEYAQPVGLAPSDHAATASEADFDSCHGSPRPMSDEELPPQGGVTDELPPQGGVPDVTMVERLEGPPPQGGAQPNPPLRSIWESGSDSSLPALTAGSDTGESELSWNDPRRALSGMMPHGSESEGSVISAGSEEAWFFPTGRATRPTDPLPPSGRHAWPQVPDFFPTAQARRAWQEQRTSAGKFGLFTGPPRPTGPGYACSHPTVDSRCTNRSWSDFPTCITDAYSPRPRI